MVGVGGQFEASNIHFTDCASCLAGSGTAPGDGCNNQSARPHFTTSYHEGIFVSKMQVEDGEDHHVADFGLIDGLCVKGVVGRKRTRTYSGCGGLRLVKLKHANIDANVTDTNIGAIRFKEDAGFAELAAIQNVRITGAYDTGDATSDAITMDCLDTIYVTFPS